MVYGSFIFHLRLYLPEGPGAQDFIIISGYITSKFLFIMTVFNSTLVIVTLQLWKSRKWLQQTDFLKDLP